MRAAEQEARAEASRVDASVWFDKAIAEAWAVTIEELKVKVAAAVVKRHKA